MSSTMSSSEIRTMVSRRHLEGKTQRLVRTSSLEKIKRFNTYICSQQYYVLPALLAWLRSSQSVLQSSTETTIFLFRSLMFNLVYKLYQIEFRSLISSVLVLVRRSCGSVEQTVVLRVAVYLTAFILAAELSLCFYLLGTTQVPSGLVFLIVCWFYIIYLNLRSVYFSPEKKASDVRKLN